MTIALALTLGMIAQALAHHLRLPGIVLLLAAGLAFGPDGVDIIRPAALGEALNILIGFAVAVILFEGGMNLKIRRLKRAQRSIRRLILIGGLVTVAGGAVAAHYILAWPWKNAVLFGTLVMVTGPTVINPLLKRLKVKRSVATVLEAEGILIDAVGAVVAMVALEAALSPHQGSPLVLAWHVIFRIGFGAVCGSATAALLIFVCQSRRWVPEGSANVFTLSVVLALFQISNMIVPESGIAAVVMAGIGVGNFSAYALRELLEFKEELTVMLIGLLFVLLAADVRLAQVAALGWPGFGVVLALMFLIRPLAVFAGTGSSGLKAKERLFIAWIGPRGIVAAAVASFFAAAFFSRGMAGGYELRAMVFLVIAVTVVFAGLTGGLMAGWLGVRRPSQMGWVILGANSLARALAKLFKEDGQEVVCIDSNTDNCNAAGEDCTRVLYGNGLQARYLLRAEIDIRRGALALTANDEVNFLFVQKVKEEARELALFTVLEPGTTSLSLKMLHQAGVALAFGAPIDVTAWCRRLESKQVHLQIWSFSGEAGTGAVDFLPINYTGSGLLAAAMRRNGRLTPVGDATRFKQNDEICFLVFEAEQKAVSDFLTAAGWRMIDQVDKDVFSTSSCQLA